MQISEFTQVDFTCWIIHFASLNFDFLSWMWFHNLEMIPQLGDDLQLHSQLGGDFVRWFAAKEHFHRPFCSPCLHLHSYEPCCKITSKLRMKLQIISKLRNHFQVVKSHSTYKIKVQTWKMDNSTCEIHICNLRYLLPTKLDFFLKIFCVNFYFLLVINQRYYWDIS